jgi:hypothetical protein
MLRLADGDTEYFIEHGLSQGLGAARKDIEIVYC